MSLENDTKSERMLVAIHENGGSANTTEIRQMAGLSNDDVNYRHRKLESEGYIEVDPPEPNRRTLQPKVAHLTEQGTEYVESLEQGADFEVKTPEVNPRRVRSEFDSMREEIEQLEGNLQQTTDSIMDTAKVVDNHEYLMTGRYAVLFEEIEAALDEFKMVLQEQKSPEEIEYDGLSELPDSEPQDLV
jgi:DNA-binding MarR family transcriptional regulator